MQKIALLVLSLSILLATLNFPAALAHNEIERGDITIVGGWGTEPPLVGQFNTVILEVSRISDGQPINNAIAQLDASLQKGGETRSLEFVPAEEPGLYTAEIIPTQTGQYAIVLAGTVAGQAFDGQIEIEDVGSTRLLEFPPSETGGNGNPIPQELLGQMQNVITELATQVDQSNAAAEEAKQAAQAATESAGELKLAADRAYLFGIIGVGIGAAGVAIGVIALSRRERVQVQA